MGEDREWGEIRLPSGFQFLLVLHWVMKNSVQGKNTEIRWKFTVVCRRKQD